MISTNLKHSSCHFQDGLGMRRNSNHFFDLASGWTTYRVLAFLPSSNDNQIHSHSLIELHQPRQNACCALTQHLDKCCAQSIPPGHFQLFPLRHHLSSILRIFVAQLRHNPLSTQSWPIFHHLDHIFCNGRECCQIRAQQGIWMEIAESHPCIHIPDHEPDFISNVRCFPR